jgi:hypothetical protein
MTPQVEGFVGKQLGRSGAGAMGKPYAIEPHPGHGFARRDLRLTIGHQACITQVNEAYVFDHSGNPPSMIQAVDAHRFPLGTSAASR